MECRFPRTVKNARGKHVEVSCQSCMPCRVNRAQVWKKRLTDELRGSLSAHFLTLTYADEHLTYGGTGHPTLVKSDVQEFNKRLVQAQRRECKKLGKTFQKVRYYVVGEYGESETARPHYHSIHFNIEPTLIPEIHKIWRKGFVRVDQVNPKSIGYVTKYITKVDSRIVATLQVERPFSMMSLKPGLGTQYIHSFKEYHSRERNLVSYVNEQGNRVTLPRYYLKKYYPGDLTDISENAQYELGMRRLEAKKRQWEKDRQIRKQGQDPKDYKRQEFDLHERNIRKRKRNKIR